VDGDQLIARDENDWRTHDVTVGEALQLHVGQLVLVVRVEQIAQPTRRQLDAAEDPAIGGVGDKVIPRRKGFARGFDRPAGRDAQRELQPAWEASNDHPPTVGEGGRA
jgi:hypothetical protein